jgi:hypothetical protein
LLILKIRNADLEDKDKKGYIFIEFAPIMSYKIWQYKAKGRKKYVMDIQ